MDLQPLVLVDLTHSRCLDDDLLVELVDLGIHNAMAHGFNDPLLNIILIDIKKLGHFLERLLALLTYSCFLDAANLDVLLLQNSLLFLNTCLL